MARSLHTNSEPKLVSVSVRWSCDSSSTNRTYSFTGPGSSRLSKKILSRAKFATLKLKSRTNCRISDDARSNNSGIWEPCLPHQKLMPRLVSRSKKTVLTAPQKMSPLPLLLMIESILQTPHTEIVTKRGIMMRWLRQRRTQLFTNPPRLACILHKHHRVSFFLSLSFPLSPCVSLWSTFVDENQSCMIGMGFGIEPVEEAGVLSLVPL